MNIWRFQEQVTSRLLLWAVFNIFTGMALLRAPSFWRGFGTQSLSWGVINLAIALFGSTAAQRRQSQPGALDTSTLESEANSLRRLLWINAALDILYMVGGRAWTRRSQAGSFGHGSGQGVIMQGLYLFLFDIIHALSVPPRGGAGR